MFPGANAEGENATSIGDAYEDECDGCDVIDDQTSIAGPKFSNSTLSVPRLYGCKPMGYVNLVDGFPRA